MQHQTDAWLLANSAILGTQVPHWAIVIAGLILVALLVAWFERPKRSPALAAPRAAAAYETSALSKHSVSRPT